MKIEELLEEHGHGWMLEEHGHGWIKMGKIKKNGKKIKKTKKWIIWKREYKLRDSLLSGANKSWKVSRLTIRKRLIY